MLVPDPRSRRVGLPVGEAAESRRGPGARADDPAAALGPPMPPRSAAGPRRPGRTHSSSATGARRAGGRSRPRRSRSPNEGRFGGWRCRVRRVRGRRRGETCRATGAWSTRSARNASACRRRRRRPHRHRSRVDPGRRSGSSATRRNRARPPDVGQRDDEAPVGELQDVVEAIGRVAGGGAHGVDLLDVEAAFEDCELVEQPLKTRIEQVMAPGHGGVERPLAVGSVAHARTGQRKPGREAIADDGRREIPDPGGGQLDAQRQIVEERADLGDDRSRPVRAPSRVARHVPGPRRSATAASDDGTQDQFALARDMERGAARHDEPAARRRRGPGRRPRRPLRGRAPCCRGR